MTCHVFVFGKTPCLLLREDHDFRCCQVTFNILDADKAESYSGEPRSLGSSVGHVTVFLDLRIGFLVGGDWNMTFIFPYVGNNHPN